MVLLRKNPGTEELAPFWVLDVAVSVRGGVGKTSAAFSTELRCGSGMFPDLNQRRAGMMEEIGNLMVEEGLPK
jgi:hypothetical protein